MNKEIKEAIAILEKILKPLDASEPQCKLNLNPEKIRKAILLLKQQPKAGEFTKECREEISELLPLPGSNQLKCSQCGRLVAYNNALTYDVQSHCERKDGGQMMGIGWAGWLNMMRDFIRFEVPKLCDRLDRAEAINKDMRDGKEACDIIDEWEKRYEDVTGGMMKKEIKLIQENVKLQSHLDRAEAENGKLLDTIMAAGFIGQGTQIIGDKRYEELKRAEADNKRLRELVRCSNCSYWIDEKCDYWESPEKEIGNLEVCREFKNTSEAINKDLLEACRQAFNESHNPKVEKVLKAAIAKAKKEG